MSTVRLDLPEPPSPNAAPQHPMERVRWKNRTRWETWKAAVQQEPPTTDPPDPVLVVARFRLHQPRDEDNLISSLKYVLDALRLPDEGEDVGWRRGLYTAKGYIVDDSPDHLTLGVVHQEVDRNNRGLTLELIPLEELDREAREASGALPTTPLD